MTGQTNRQPPRRSLWPYAIIASLLGVVAVQAVLVTVATRNAPVLESETAYADALDHDAVMQARAASAALGWQVTVDVMPDGVVYRVVDRRGLPVRGLSGTLRMVRADTAAADAEVAFEEQAPGIYRAARSASEGVYRLAARLEGGPDPFVDTRRVVFP